jgi:hypothetical protein
MASSSYELVIYIRNEMALNTPREQIIAHLVAAGWQREEVEQAFREASKTAGFPAGTVTFTDLQPKQSRHILRSIGRWVVALLLCVVIVFTAFSILFNLGLVGPKQESTITSSTLSPAIAPPVAATSTSSSVIVPVVPVVLPPVATSTSTSTSTTTSISHSDKDQIISAILTQGTVMQSGSAANIRNYLEITASLAYHSQLQTMSDSDILALASSMTIGQSYVTANSLNSSEATWQQVDATTVKVTVQTANGPVTRTSEEVNGVWY